MGVTHISDERLTVYYLFYGYNYIITNSFNSKCPFSKVTVLCTSLRSMIYLDIDSWQPAFNFQSESVYSHCVHDHSCTF